MSNSDRFASEYTTDDEQQFDEYLQNQINKIEIPNKDETFLRKKMIEMYGNTVKNSLQTS
ncbi:MAG TPA: hypothetical protein DCS09_08800 [Porphyromonadaceae bacterium]|nr:hypothetical protein [Porphyromonadaceae bacterium]